MTKLFLEKLNVLKKHGIKNNIPNISYEIGMFLNMLIKNKKIKNVLEIGTANGYSTIWMAEALKETNGSITTFEVSIPSFKEATSNFSNFKLNKYINSLFCDFLEYDFKKLKNKTKKLKLFDLIFIDGQKNKTLDFFNKAKKLIKKDSIIIVDDVIKFKSKMSEFYNYIEKQNEFYYLVIPIDINDGIMLITKK